jgi:soluble lytic murein transglycosylase-like protein
MGLPTTFARVGLPVGAVLLLLGAGNADAPEAERVVLQRCMPAAMIREPADAAPVRVGAHDPMQRAMVEEVARRFRIALRPAGLMVESAFRAADQVGLDPLLVLAVIAIESRFNPFAESVAGAKGLMQIIPRFHRAKLEPFGGEEALLDPQSNILVGARILQEYVYRTGTLEAGLQLYNGAFGDSSAKYAFRVLAERERLEEALRAVLPSRKRAHTNIAFSPGGL